MNAQTPPKAAAATPVDCHKLSFVEVQLNEKITSGLVNSGVTHNYMAVKRAVDLGLKVQAGMSSFKAVNSLAKKVVGIVRDAPTTVGMWQGHMDYMVIEMDDFKLILGQEFLRLGFRCGDPTSGVAHVHGFKVTGHGEDN